jgi:hypothetical protein
MYLRWVRSGWSLSLRLFIYVGWLRCSDRHDPKNLTTLNFVGTLGALQHCDTDVYELQLRMSGIRSVLRSRSPSELR